MSEQTEAFFKEKEEKFWSSGILGSDDPKSLLHAVFYLNENIFCLCREKKQRNLKISQFGQLNNPGIYIYTENSSKNRCGGVKQLHVNNKLLQYLIWRRVPCVYFRHIPSKAFSSSNTM